MTEALASRLDYLQALRRLPYIEAAALLRGRHLLVIAPHPDDESLGVGGLIAHAAASGLAVTVAFLTGGEGSHPGSPSYPPARLAELRRAEASAALEHLGAQAAACHYFELPDGHIADSEPAARAAVEQALTALLAERGESLVCVTASTDRHADHRAAAALARRVCASSGSECLEYPVWTWAQAPAELPDLPPRGWRIDIGAFRGNKQAAIAAHRSQHGEVIADAAEAFVLDRAFLAHFGGADECLVRADD